MTKPLTVSALAGVWTRSLLIDVDGRQNVATGVTWIQGPSLFVDLRVPPSVPGYESIEGFAGVLVEIDTPTDDLAVQWQRHVDLDDARSVPDAGTLTRLDDLLVETGIHEPYVEHWTQTGAGQTGAGQTGAGQTGAGQWTAADGSMVVAVQVGSHFGCARTTASSTVVEIGIAMNSPAGDTGSLTGHITASSDPDRVGALFDLTSLFSVSSAAWTADHLEGKSLL